MVNQKFARLRSLDLSIGSAEAFDGSEDVIGGLGPFEGLGIGVVMTDEVHNVGAQSLDAAIDAAPDLLVGDEREEALDLIEPGGAGRREVDMPARPFDQGKGNLKAHTESCVDAHVSPPARGEYTFGRISALDATAKPNAPRMNPAWGFWRIDQVNHRLGFRARYVDRKVVWTCFEALLPAP